MRLATLLILLLTGAGCNSVIISGAAPSGYILTKTIVPLTRNLNNTPVVRTNGRGSIIHIEEPVSGYGVYAEFNSNAIGDIARKHGLKTVHWADLETFDILGVYRQQRVHLYGE